MIMGDGIKDNMYLREGRRIHEKIAENKLRLLPFIKDTAIFEGKYGEKNMQNYFRVPVFEWLDMSMVADVLDPVEKLLIDWKTGMRKSTEHNQLQLYVYAYLLTRLPEPVEIEKAIIGKVRETKEGAIICDDFSLYKINEEKLALAENYIESNASEIFNFLQEVGNG
jgi:hypothetical protein